MEPIPVLSSLSTLYRADQSQRYHDLISRFRSEFNRAPDFIARAPGRVNLIGEHIDYEGYGVLPMALENDTLVAVARLPEGGLDVRNTSPQFAGTVLPTDPEFMQEKSWVNYFIAGYKAATSAIPSPASFAALVDGNVPIASGLSSSSSITVASAVAAAYVNCEGRTGVTRQEIAELTATYERMVGLAGGGMDQAIAVLANKGEASLIEFNPLTTQPVLLPGGLAFVIGNSLTESAKVVTQATCYNKRVVECRLGVAYLAEIVGAGTAAKTYKELQDAAGLSFAALEQLIDQHLTEAAYSKADLEVLFATTQLYDLVSDVPYSDLVLSANDEFKLRQRGLHVVREAQRVYQFKEACAAGDVERLGTLMNDSHNSCRTLYECSSEQLDKLTALALKYGALGARLTGAGWGGCAIALVPNASLRQVIKGLEGEFYGGRAGGHLFVTEAGRGACVVDLSQAEL
jgi:N-acetylgalactosamine kinase